MKITTLIIAVAVTIVCVLAGLLIIQKNALDALETESTELRVANLTLTQSIARLTEQRKVDDRIVTEFTQNLTALRAASDTQTKLISDLEKSDPDVKDYLSIRIPTSLSGLLTNGTDEDGAGVSTGQPVDQVPGKAQGTDGNDGRPVNR